MTLAAKADTCIGGSVLDEDGGLHGLGEAGEVVDVLGVHVSGVTVAMLSLASQINGLVDVLDTDDTQDGHHQLLLHEQMLEGNLCDGAADLGAHVDADLGEDDVSVTAHAIAVDHVGDLAGLLVDLLVQHHLGQLVSLLTGEEDTAVLLHTGDETVGHVVEDEDLLLGDAGKVVVEGAAVDDVLGSLLDVGGVVHDDGGVTRAGTDGLLAGGKHSLDHAGAAGADQQLDGGVLVHHVSSLQGGLGHGSDQNLGAAHGVNGAVDQVNCVVGGSDGTGVRIEYHTVAGGDHAHAVADDGLGGVGGGSDGTHHTEGSALGEGQTVVTGLGLGHDILGAGGLVGHQHVLGGLVIHATHLGLSDTESGHGACLGAAVVTDGSDELLAVSDAGGADGLVACLGGGDGLLHGGVNADQLATVVLGRTPVFRGSGGTGADLGDDLRDQLGNLRFSPVDCHVGSSFLFK